MELKNLYDQNPRGEECSLQEMAEFERVEQRIREANRMELQSNPTRKMREEE